MPEETVLLRLISRVLNHTIHRTVISIITVRPVINADLPLPGNIKTITAHRARGLRLGTSLAFINVLYDALFFERNATGMPSHSRLYVCTESLPGLIASDVPSLGRIRYALYTSFKP